MMKKEVLSIALTGALTLSLAAPALAAEAQTFTDVPEGAWYAGAVEYVSQKGLMAGTGKDLFSPAGTVTPVSYTHLDVYKRQGQCHWQLGHKITDALHRMICAGHFLSSIRSGQGPAPHPPEYRAPPAPWPNGHRPARRRVRLPFPKWRDSACLLYTSRCV